MFKLTNVFYLLALVFGLLGCGVEPAHVPKTAEAVGCVARCKMWNSCGPEDPACDDRCHRDEKTMVDGFAQSHTECLAHTLERGVCDSESVKAKREQAERICYLATVEAYATKADNKRIVAMAEATCARMIRCEPPTGSAPDKARIAVSIEQCRLRLQEDLSSNVHGAILRVLREPIASRLIRCSRDRTCGDTTDSSACDE